MVAFLVVYYAMKHVTSLHYGWRHDSLWQSCHVYPPDWTLARDQLFLQWFTQSYTTTIHIQPMLRKSSYPSSYIRYGLCRRYGLGRRFFQGFLVCSLIWTTLEVLFIHHRYSMVDRIQPSTPRQFERIYIASMHWNNEAILRSHWNDAVVELAKTWGPENVFVSVFESGSWDDSKGALRDLDARLDRLGVRRNITLSDTTHEDEISSPSSGQGWVDTPRGQRELRRIPYLARLRNLTLRPLEDLTEEGIMFDKVLFLNDVVFTVCV